MRTIATYAMKGRYHAFFLATLFALIPFLGWIGSAIMGLVTLRRGAREGLLILLGLIAADFIYFHFDAIGKGYILYDTLGNNIPTYFAAIYLRQTASWNKLIELLAYVTVGILIIIHLFFPELSAWWGPQILKLLKQVHDKTGAQVPQHTSQALANLISQYILGLQAIIASIIILFNLVIARYLQSLLYNPKGFKKELFAIHMPKRLAYLFIFVSCLPWLNITIVNDLLPVLALPFIFSAISLFQDFISKRSSSWAWLISFYALLLLALPYVCLALIIIGLLDTFYNLRKYLKQSNI